MLEVPEMNNPRDKGQNKTAAYEYEWFNQALWHRKYLCEH